MAQINISGSIGSSGAAILGATIIEYLTDADHTMTPDEYTNQYLLLSGELSTTRNLIAPTLEGMTYIIKNNTTSGTEPPAIVIKTSAGTGVVIPNGLTMTVVCDGTNYVLLSGGVGTLNSFVFQPGGVATGNVYTDFITLANEIQNIQGKVTIYIDGNFSENVPAGEGAGIHGIVWILSTADGSTEDILPMPNMVEFVGVPMDGYGPDANIYPQLMMTSYAGFANAPTELTFTNLRVINQSNDNPPAGYMHVSNSNMVLNLKGDGYIDATWYGFTAYPLIVATNSTIEINIYGKMSLQNSVGTSDQATISADGNSYITINMFDGSNLGSNTINYVNAPVVNIYNEQVTVDGSFSDINYANSDVTLTYHYNGSGGNYGSVFNSWSALVNHLNTLNPVGLVTIYICADAAYDNVAVIPTGTYSLPYALHLIGVNAAGGSLSGDALPLTLNTAVIFDPPPIEFTQTNLCITYTDDTVMTIDGGTYNTYFRHTVNGTSNSFRASFINGGGGFSTPSFIALTNGAIGSLNLYGQASTQWMTTAPYSVDATSSLTVNLYDNSDITNVSVNNVIVPDSGGTVTINVLTPAVPIPNDFNYYKTAVNPGYSTTAGVTINNLPYNTPPLTLLGTTSPQIVGSTGYGLPNANQSFMWYDTTTGQLRIQDPTGAVLTFGSSSVNGTAFGMNRIPNLGIHSGGGGS